MKYANRTLTAILAVLILVCTPIQAMALENPTNDLESRITAIIGNGYGYTIVGSTQLKDSAGTTQYVCYTLSPFGYAIYNTSTNNFEEISPYSAASPYPLDTASIYYYFGPGQYYTLVNEDYIHTESGKVLSSSELSKLANCEIQKKALEATITSPNISQPNMDARGSTRIFVDRTISNETYFTSLLGNRFPDNRGVTCTTVATAILLGYYDYYVSDLYVPTAYENGCGTTDSFHQYVQDYINPNDSTGATGLGEARTGLNDYFSDRGINCTARSIAANHEAIFDIVCSKVDANRPIIAAMFSSYNSACEDNHSTVVYGYCGTFDGTIAAYVELYYYVHDGSKNLDRLEVVNYAWFGDAVYLST